jgi:glycine/D-amino acid oxidase-like deaminating enzyme
LWVDREPDRREAFPALRGDLTVDVAIVGGGFTGATIAWWFADAGVRVAVLEAARIGRGSTAASTALLMQEPDEDFAALVERYGERTTRRIWELGREATRLCVDTLRRLDIACDLSERDSVYYALMPEAGRRLRDEQRRRSAAGFGGRWLARAALEQRTGIAGAAGIRTRGNAQLDPVRACLGLIRAAADRGAAIFEHARVTRVSQARDHVTLTTARGRVRADCLVIATGYATPAFRPLAGRFRLLNTYVVATRPLTSAERRRLGLGPIMLWDTDRPYHYARWTSDHRLLLGGADKPRRAGRNRRHALRAGVRVLREYFTRLYPSLADVHIDYQWDGVFAMTPDSLPYIGPHRRYPRHLFALGYGGNGMTFGFLAGRLLLDAYRGVPTNDLDLFAFSRHARLGRDRS